jgi:guanine deaminase
LKSRQPLSRSLEDVLFALMMLGDERAVRATYVAGTRVHHGGT